MNEVGETSKKQPSRVNRKLQNSPVILYKHLNSGLFKSVRKPGLGSNAPPYPTAGFDGHSPKQFRWPAIDLTIEAIKSKNPPASFIHTLKNHSY